MSLDSMSPMEAFAWFDTPIETTVTTINGTIQIVKANVRRVALLIGSPVAGANFTVSTSSALGANQGFSVPTNGQWLTFTQRDFGPLPALDWFAFATIAGGFISTLEIILREWPKTRAGQREVSRAIAATARFGRGRHQ